MFRDTKKSHNAQLRAACEAALKEIQEMVGSDTASEGDNVSISSVLPDLHDAAKLDADKYFLPFRYFVQIFLVTMNDILIFQPGLSEQDSPAGGDLAGRDSEADRLRSPDRGQRQRGEPDQAADRRDRGHDLQLLLGPAD